MTKLAVVDAGPLYAAADADDAGHASSLAALSRQDLRLVVPALVVAEATYFVGRRLGAAAEYADLPLGGTDASIIALAERLDTPIVVTLDRRHFGAVKPRHREAFEILP